MEVGRGRRGHGALMSLASSRRTRIASRSVLDVETIDLLEPVSKNIEHLVGTVDLGAVDSHRVHQAPAGQLVEEGFQRGDGEEAPGLPVLQASGSQCLRGRRGTPTSRT